MAKERSGNPGGLASQQAEVERAIQKACQTSFGVLDTSFLCRSVSVLEPKKPLSVSEDDSVESVVEVLRKNRIGCVLVLGEQGRLRGIFSERDVLLKLVGDFASVKSKPIRQFMTPDPVTQPPDATIGFVLNLMSSGGFRHMPIVDGDGMPIGIVSVKDVIDFIVKSFTDALLNFESPV